jgi:hypothetical protein
MRANVILFWILAAFFAISAAVLLIEGCHERIPIAVAILSASARLSLVDKRDV